MAWTIHGVGSLVAGAVGYWVGSNDARIIYEMVVEDDGYGAAGETPTGPLQRLGSALYCDPADDPGW